MKLASDNRLRYEIAEPNGFRGIIVPPTYGLLFEKAGTFVMNGVGVNLDVVFLDRQNTIVEIQTMTAELPAMETPIDQPERYYSCSVPCAMALETDTGYCRDNGWVVGDTLKFQNGYCWKEEELVSQTKIAFKNRIESTPSVLLDDTVYEYFMGLGVTRWSLPAVRRVFQGLRVIEVDSGEVDQTPVKTLEDAVNLQSFSYMTAFFEFYKGKSPVLYVLKGSLANNPDIVCALAIGVHKAAMPEDWVTPITVKGAQKILNAYGITDANLKSYLYPALNILKYMKQDELLAKMETLLYLESIGTEYTDIVKWLRSKTPDQIKKCNPEVLDYLLSQYHLGHHALKQSGWPLPSIVDIHPIEKESSMKLSSLYSVVTPPKRGLDAKVWEDANGTPKLKQFAKEEILTSLYDGLKERGFSEPEKWCARVLVLGSITGNQYEKDSDIDVTVVIDYDAFLKYESDNTDPKDTSDDVFKKVSYVLRDYNKRYNKTDAVVDDLYQDSAPFQQVYAALENKVGSTEACRESVTRFVVAHGYDTKTAQQIIDEALCTS